jgi:dihydroorotase
LENAKNETMSRIILRNAQIVNEGKTFVSDLSIKDGRIEKIAGEISDSAVKEIDLKGNYLLPGCIDDQVHFREPGLTHKGDLFTESRAAVAGGITSFMEMPNTVPNALTQDLLEEKYNRAGIVSIANHSFYMGVSNTNLSEVLKTNEEKVCGIKVFMGSSTGNMLVDNERTLEALFSQSPMLIATHCEDEHTVQENLRNAKLTYGDQIPIQMHPEIRSAEACYLSSSFAVNLAKKHGTRLHVLHISTGKETLLFEANVPLRSKKITAEACIHHLWFCDADYALHGNAIKWNPAVKSANDRAQIWKALLEDRIDVIATDHAPHTLEEKNNPYLNAPSGGPLVQHALVAMLEKQKEGVLTLEKVVEKMSHAPAVLFRIKDRGFVREGYYADLVEVDAHQQTTVSKANLLYKCGWSPFEGHCFSHSIKRTFVNGNMVFENGEIIESTKGMRLLFDKAQ